MSSSSSSSASSSPSSIIIAAAFTLFLPLISAHGFVSGVIAGGTWYPGTSPEWIYHAEKPATAGWYAENQDNGFVAPSAFADPDIICHREAAVGLGSVPVTAGEQLDLQWNTWPESHHGPVITYLAAVEGEFTAVAKEGLNWFKIDATGLIDGATAPGNWATDELMANNLTSTVTIPADIAAGNYVLRHEIIALHSAGQEDGAQAYPQCINIKLSSSGTATPCSEGADCALGTKLYTSTDAGILVNIYTAMTDYTIPGPKLYGSGDGAAATPSPNVTVKIPEPVVRNQTATATAIESVKPNFSAMPFWA